MDRFIEVQCPACKAKHAVFPDDPDQLNCLCGAFLTLERLTRAVRVGQPSGGGASAAARLQCPSSPSASEQLGPGAYADLAGRYTNGEPVQIAGTVYWNVAQSEAKQGGLAGMATNPTAQAKALALGLAFGPAGVLASGSTDKSEPAKCTCDLGVLAVGNHRVFLLKLGTVKMIGESATYARLPSELIDHIPATIGVKQIIAFRPLNVETNGDTLRVHILGKPPVAFDSAFENNGGCLVVRAPARVAADPFGASLAANAIRGFATYPLPEEVMASLFVRDGQPTVQRAEPAFAESDYAESFVRAYKLQKKEVRRAFVLAARAGSDGLKGIADKCARGPGRGSGSRYFTSAIGVLMLAPWTLFVVFGVYALAVAPAAVPDADTILAILGFVLMFAFSFLGLLLLYMLWSEMRERRLECRLLAEGGGFGGSLDALLANLAWREDRRAPVNWGELQTALASNPQFALNLCDTIRGMKKERCKTFILSAPRGPREILIEKLLVHRPGFRGVVSPEATLRYVAVWLPCLVLGIFSTAHGILHGTPSVGNWLVFILGLLGFGGANIGIVLLAIQSRAWWHRRWVRRELRTEGQAM